MKRQPKNSSGSLVRPLDEADLSRVEAVFTDVDGTLTTKGQLTATTLKAIEWLVAHEVKVVFVSGRPAGWGECWARQLPVAGVIVENGGLYFARSQDGRLKKEYVQPLATRLVHRKRLVAAVSHALKLVPGARLSMDSQATEVDIAIDYAEEANLGPAAADALERALHARGVTAVRSSVHVNAWLGDFDKRSTVERFVKAEWKSKLATADARYVYVGDSFNDQPMFKAFSLSVGVANVLDLMTATSGHPALVDAPKFVTRGREGQGFAEVADAVVRARAVSKQSVRKARR